MRFNSDNQVNGNWKQRYLDTDQIDYSAANKLVVKDFLLDSNDLKYNSHLVHYILLNILSVYFAQALNKQKVRH